MEVNPTDIKQDMVKPNDQNQENIKPTDVKQDSAEQSENHTIPYSTFKKELDKRKELEVKLNKISETQKKAKQNQLEKDGMLKEALEMAKKENEELSGYKQQLAEYENAKREKLINSLPEDKREKASTFDISALQELSDMYNEFTKSTNQPQVNVTNAPAQRVNQSVDLKKDWFNMSAEDKRKNWGDIMNVFSKK